MLATMAVLATLAIGPGAALAATYQVNTTADSTDTGGCTTAHVCSLRDAVNAADAHSGSTIMLPAGTYLLNTTSPPPGQLDITAPTTIIGAGPRLTTINGHDISRVFDIEGTGAAAAIENLTVTHGHTPAVGVSYVETDPGDGAGIFSLGKLDLERVAVVANTSTFGGAGVMYGTVHSFPGRPPGGTWDTVTIARNHVRGGAGNGQGGGFVAATDLTLTNSTVADNTVENPGTNEGGGMVSTDGIATLLNDTISDNTAAEPVASPAGDFGGGVSGDTLAGGGPFTSVLNATNTIVARNTADGAERNCSFIDTGASTSSHNIQGDTSCSFTDPGSKTTVKVGLGPLQNNGGPLDTMLPGASSPAINAGDASKCPSIDERGVMRPQGAGCDIGAVELAPPTATTGPPSKLKFSTAKVSGTASNPAVAAGSARFEFGTTTSYGRTVSAGPVPAGRTNFPRGAKLHGLKPGTTYHYQILVTTTDGTAFGGDRTFKTQRAPTRIRITGVQVFPIGHGCVAKSYRPGTGSHSTLVASASCPHVRLVVHARVSRRLNHPAEVAASGGPGGHFKFTTTGKSQFRKGHPGQPYPDGHLTGTLQLPARSHPDRWTIGVSFHGDAKYMPGHDSTVRLIEVGKPRSSTSPRRKPGFTG